MRSFLHDSSVFANMNTKGFASLQEAEAAIQRDMVELALQDLANAGFIEVETDEEG